MVTLDLGTLISLTGLMLGIAFGLTGGTSREEKIRIAAITVFGSILVAFIGAKFVANFSLEFLFYFLLFSLLGFIVSFMIGLLYHKLRNRGSGASVINF